MKLSTGYHYTSEDCWKKIRVRGLQPYEISKPEFVQLFGTHCVKGIWIWDTKIKGLAHRGCILYQMSHKNTIRAVLLRVRFDREKILHPLGHDTMTLRHFGKIENLDYHTGRETAVIVYEVIPPSQIELVEKYCLLDIWRPK